MKKIFPFAFYFFLVYWGSARASPSTEETACLLEPTNCGNNSMVQGKYINNSDIISNAIKNSALSLEFDLSVLKENPSDVAAPSMPPELASRYTLSPQSEAFRRFEKAVKDAEVPDCLHSDGLKRQSTSILFVEVRGVYALPFVALAKARGKCK